ncbi:ATPase inhibitor mai-2, mitochondrial-like isoform X1 [Amphiura filiformis]|uniref:ATPase inhibitor mai-2, mitochondrial-like isoform X1 n=1 Tax=Amphiura filiformis TaxID=82378 RepID=UPI003B20D589
MSLILARLAGIRVYRPVAAVCQVRCMAGGESGSGAGRSDSELTKTLPTGGGTGGSIRDAGGSFGKMEAAHEEQYFRKLQSEQFKNLKRHHDDEIEAHEREIRRHQEEVHRLKKRVDEIDQLGKKGSDSD